MFQVVAKNTASQLIGRAISSISMVVLSFLIASRFGTLGYGEFVKITTFVGLFYLFADFGLNAIALQRTDATWRTLLGLRLLMGVVLSVVSIGIISMMPRGVDQGYTDLVRFGIYLLTPAIIVQAVITTANAYFQKKLRYDYSAAAQIVGSLVMVATALMLAYLSPVDGPLMGVISLLVGGVVTMSVALGIITQQIRNILPVVNMGDYRWLFVTATPLGLALIFNLVYFHADSVILALTRSTQEVGIYGLAYKVFELPLVLPIFFMNAVYPLLLRTKSRGTNEEHRIFFKALWFLVLSSLIIGSIVWFAAPLVSLIRPEFVLSVAPLRILLIGMPIFFVSGLLMWFLIAKQLGMTLLTIHGVAMVGNILANVMLVPIHGYFASAWITVVSEFFVLCVSAVVIWRKGL